MGELGDKLAQALEEKSNDVNSFIWKLPKKEVNGEIVQDSIKMMEATPEQLNEFYNHSLSMLYNTDSKRNPGRFKLKQIVNEQRHKCNVELYIRYVEGKYMNISGRKAYPRFLYLQDLKSLLANSGVSSSDYDKISIESTITPVPEEFRDIMVSDVIDACLDILGYFDKKHLSLNFIADLGLWPTKQEKKDLEEVDPNTGKVRDWIDVIKERHGLRNDLKIRITSTGLNYSELRAMLNLKSKKYSELTTDQLVLLRNKVLFRFEQKVDMHIRQWEERIRQLRLVAQTRGIELKNERG